MHAQSIIPCTEKCNDIINLLKNSMDGRKIISTANNDINLELKTLKKVTTAVGRAASNHLTSYANIMRKRKRVQEEDEFYLKNTQCGNSASKKARFNCTSFIEREDSIIIKTTPNKNRKYLHRNSSSIMKIGEFDKRISFPKPKSDLLYTPTEFVECLIENVDSQDRCFFVKLVIQMKLISINYFCVVLRYIQKYRKGVSLP